MPVADHWKTGLARTDAGFVGECRARTRQRLEIESGRSTVEGGVRYRVADVPQASVCDPNESDARIQVSLLVDDEAEAAEA